MSSLRWLVALLVLGTIAASPAPPTPRWEVTPSAFCRYDIDVSRLSAPPAALDRTPAAMHVTCPFNPGQASSAQVYARKVGVSDCSKDDVVGLTVVGVTQISQHELGVGVRCAAWAAPTRPIEQAAPGQVFVIQGPHREDGARAPAGFVDQILSLTTLEGLPIVYADGEGTADQDFVCLEMLKGATLDPYAYFRSRGVQFPAGTRVFKGDPNCRAATTRLGGPLILRGAPRRSPFVVRLRASSASPRGVAFDNAFLAAMSANGMPVGIGADGVFTPLAPGDSRPVVLERLDGSRADFELRSVDGQSCKAVFAAMLAVDGFITPPDDRSPTIILAEGRGGPPARYLALSLTSIGSAEALCQALTEPFSRRRADAG